MDDARRPRIPASEAAAVVHELFEARSGGAEVCEELGVAVNGCWTLQRAQHILITGSPRDQVISQEQAHRREGAGCCRIASEVIAANL